MKPWMQARPMSEVRAEFRWAVLRDVLGMLAVIAIVCAIGIVGTP